MNLITKFAVHNCHLVENNTQREIQEHKGNTMRNLVDITFGFQSISLSMGFTLQTTNSTAWGGRHWNSAGKWSSW